MSISRSIKSNQYAEVKKRDQTIRVSTLALGNTVTAHNVPNKHKRQAQNCTDKEWSAFTQGVLKLKKSDLSLKLDCDWSAKF